MLNAERFPTYRAAHLCFGKVIFLRMKIFCAACGKQIDFHAAWRDSLSQTKICDKKCLEKIQDDYAKMILDWNRKTFGR